MIEVASGRWQRARRMGADVAAGGPMRGGYRCPNGGVAERKKLNILQGVDAIRARYHQSISSIGECVSGTWTRETRGIDSGAAVEYVVAGAAGKRVVPTRSIHRDIGGDRGPNRYGVVVTVAIDGNRLRRNRSVNNSGCANTRVAIERIDRYRDRAGRVKNSILEDEITAGLEAYLTSAGGDIEYGQTPCGLNRDITSDCFGSLDTKQCGCIAKVNASWPGDSGHLQNPCVDF